MNKSQRMYTNDPITVNTPTVAGTKTVKVDVTNTTSENLTVVTGIWDLKRDQAGDGFKRPFEHYITNFISLLKTNVKMYIYIEKKYESLVWKYRTPHNTSVRIKEVEEFKTNFSFYEDVQKIRLSEKWRKQADWLGQSTQATLEYYNPMVMSKMFMLHDAVCANPFNTDYYIWLDGGITNTVHEGYFTHDKILDKLEPCLRSFLFVSFPYTGNTEIHGFERTGMNTFAKAKSVDYVCRGGLFGGHKDIIRKANNTYYHLLNATLKQGYMGTEESIFTIMAYLQPDIYNRFVIQDNGLINYFAEALKNNDVQLVVSAKPKVKPVFLDKIKTALYVITFNSPKQFETLVESYLKQPNFIRGTVNYLLDNSTDASTTPAYAALCEKYGFEHIKKDNLGICGGRQFIAEHFDKTEWDYYIFLEDDMLLKNSDAKPCDNGFVSYVPDLYVKAIKIIAGYDYDFLKFSYTEFYGNNGTQWAWYNVPQEVREKNWPDQCTLPPEGTDPNSPRTLFKNINSMEGLAWADGEIYYCNWPQIVSKKGNKKMFLETNWTYYYEQTWMSHMYQLTLKNELKGAVLLASLINHDRFEHYDGSLRKET